MARPARINIVNGSAGWDADVNDNFKNLFDTPLPVATYANAAAFPAAASYENCVAIAEDVDKLYISDGASWNQVGGVTTFLNLTDVPAAYAGAGGHKVKVNAGATALEFVADPAPTFLALTDAPAAYAGAGEYKVKVNAGATALEFVADPPATTDVYSKKMGRFRTILGSDQVTGIRWTDDAQLYCKFVDQGALTNNGTKLTAHGAPYVNKIRDSWLIVSDGSGWDETCTYETQGLHEWTLNSRLYVDATNCRLRTSWNASAHYGRSFLFWDKTAGGGTTNEVGVMDYSTSEQETGWNWIDGRSIYAKTVDTGALPNAASKNVAHGITDLDHVVYFTAMSSTASYDYTQPQGFDTVSLDYKIGSINIVIESTDDRSTHTSSHATLYYVKDANDAGLNVYRGPDFAEQEQKAGFLLGTREVYFRVVDCGALPNNTTKTVAHGISNFYNLVRLTGTVYNSGTASWYSMPLVIRQDQADDGVIVRVDNTNIEIVSHSNMTAYNDTQLVLFYTKDPESLDGGKLETIRVDQDLYISSTGNDSTGNGSSTAPWATLQKAMDYLADYYVCGSATVTIHVEDGTYTAVATTTLGHPNGDRIEIIGDETASTGQTITSGNQVSKQFVVSGDHTATYPTGSVCHVMGSTLNDSTYTIANVSYGAPNTTITVSESIQAATWDGTIYNCPSSYNCIFEMANSAYVSLDSFPLKELSGICLKGHATPGDGLFLNYGATLLASDGLVIRDCDYGLRLEGVSSAAMETVIVHSGVRGMHLDNYSKLVSTKGGASCNNSNVGGYVTGGSSIYIVHDGAGASQKRSVFSQNGSHGLMALMTSILRVTYIQAIGNTATGVWVEGVCVGSCQGANLQYNGGAGGNSSGSFLDLYGATASNNTTYGTQANYGGDVVMTAGSAAGNGTAGSSPAYNTVGNSNSYITG